jgi:hypothetical protein
MGKAVKSARGFRRKVVEMERWAALGTTVGWIAVALGDYLPGTLVSEAPQTSWRSYLESYAEMRVTFLERLDSYWPRAPAWLRGLGGTPTIHQI